MKTFKYIYIIFSLFVCNSLFSQDVKTEFYNNNVVESNYIIVKFKPSLLKSEIVSPDVQKNTEQGVYSAFLKTIDAQAPKQMFLHTIMPDSCKNCVDISRIYSISFNANVSVEYVLQVFRDFSFIEYAEPNYIEQLHFVPNDAYASSQWHMNTTKVYQAWDVTQGDTNIVIAIVDAGVDIDHVDLIDQIQYNKKDPINGFDDDADGYIDNFRGWDFADNDNNPDVGLADHGTHVAGLSSAKVDNGLGISGTGYKCRLLPIKIATSETAMLTRGYEGIVYAAIKGCQIINCSWGSPNSYSQFGEDIINFATFNCNALVIASAANDGNNVMWYPASYSNALSIASTYSGDEKWAKSNFNYFVDILSPGGLFYSLMKNDGVTQMWGGTSFAAPVVSGIAGLVLSKYPNLTALELGERVRATTDDVYGVGTNYLYTDLIGSGRVNALNALNDVITPSVRMTEYTKYNSNGSYFFFADDTLELQITFKNYLADATNMFISVSCESSILAPINATVLYPTFAAGEEKVSNPTFKFEIVQTMPADFSTYIKITYSSGDYYGYEYVPISFNPSYYDFEFGNFKATATANSTIGVLTPYKKAEYGIQYANNNTSLIYEGGLCIAFSESQFAARFDSFYDFLIDEFPVVLESDTTDLLIRSRYNIPKFSFDVEQYIYGWNNTDALVHEYRITNNSGIDYTNMYVGAYMDWNIVDINYNKVTYIDSLNLGVASTIDPTGYYAGILPLHYHTKTFYAIDELSISDSIYLYDGFSGKELFYGLTKNNFNSTLLPEGGRGASLSGAFIPRFPKDTTVIVRYAIVAGNTLEEIVNSSSLLKQNYVTDTVEPVIGILEVESAAVSVEYKNNTVFITSKNFYSLTSVTLANPLGVEIYNTGDITLQKVLIDTQKIIPGIYIVSYTINGKTYSEKILIN